MPYYNKLKWRVEERQTLKSNVSAPLTNLIVKTMNSKNKLKKKDFKIPKNTGVDTQLSNTTGLH